VGSTKPSASASVSASVGGTESVSLSKNSIRGLVGSTSGGEADAEEAEGEEEEEEMMACSGW
jgi:hypothetical protein